jgi:hypothetical protein
LALNFQKKMMKKLLLGTTSSLLTVAANASPVVDISLAQAGANSEAYFIITNPDATYDCGVFKFDDVLTPVAQAVKDNNAAYSGSSLADIMNEWTISIQPNEVYGGWSATRNGGWLDLLMLHLDILNG